VRAERHFERQDPDEGRPVEPPGPSGQPEEHWFARSQAALQRRLQMPPLLGLLWLPAIALVTAVMVGTWAALVGVTFVSPAADVVSSFQNAKLPVAAPPAQSTFLYDRHGRPITMLNSGINRTIVPSSQIPRHMKQATIAVEDRNFYREGGVSPEGTLRAALTDLIHHRAVQGGSTITQQYVKLVYTGDERTLARKLREAVLAQKLSRIKTKDQILTAYLNIVYFGNEAYGVQAAAETYWHKPAHRLTVLQSATLAALIQAPATYDPYRHPQELFDRRNLVLQDMASQGYLDPALQTKLEARRVKVERPGTGPIPAAYFVDSVSRTLQKKFGVDATFHGGLRVTTTLDWSDQKAAESAIAAHLRSPQDPSAALVAIDPTSGAIRAMVGGRDFEHVKFNLATQARRQTGSAAKPFTFVTAMRQHIDPNAVLSGPPDLVIPDKRCLNGIDKPWDVHNFADETAGTMSLFDALAHSVNTIFAQLVVDVGPENVVKTMRRLGATTPLQAVCSITLGSQAVTPLEMTQMYASIADGGIRRTPQVLQQVTDPGGKVIERLNPRGVQAVPANDAWLTVKAMKGVIEHGTGTAANIGRPAAGKTGTGQDFQDAWFCGFVPQLVACVWVGYPKGEIPMHNVEGFADVFGGSLPAEIWHDFMVKAVQGLPVRDFPEPSLTGYDVKPTPVAPLPPPVPIGPPNPAPPPPRHCHPWPHCKPGRSPSPTPAPSPSPSALPDPKPSP
jgi:penicillin-binding protein 1A